MEKFSNTIIIDASNKQEIINEMYIQLTCAIKFAFTSCTRITTLKNLNKKKWFTKELKEIKNKMISKRLRSNITREDSSKLKLLKKDFKKVMKKIFSYTRRMNILR